MEDDELCVAAVCYRSDQHDQHDRQWTFCENSVELCINCIVDLCQDPQQANIKKRLWLNILITFLKKSVTPFFEHLRSNPTITNYILNVLSTLLWSQDDTISQLSCDGIVLTLIEVKSKQLVTEFVQRFNDWFQGPCNYEEIQPAIMLMANLCARLDWLGFHLVTLMQDNLLQLLISGLQYPSMEIKQNASFATVKLLTSSNLQVLSTDVKVTITKLALRILKSEQDRQLQTNVFALFCLFLHDAPTLQSALVEASPEGSTLPGTLKRLLLTQDDKLQIAVIQCLNLLLTNANLSQDEKIADELMGNDITELLCEVLNTSNGVVIESVLFCLLQFSKFQDYFKKCHSVYGIESILNAIERLHSLKIHSTLDLAYKLLNQIFTRQPTTVPLFSCEGTVERAICVLIQGINNSYRKITWEATLATESFLRTDFLRSPVPFNKLETIIEACSKTVSELFNVRWKTHIKKKTNHYSHANKLLNQADKLLMAKANILYKICKIVEDCRFDKTATEESFTVLSLTQKSSLSSSSLQNCSVKNDAAKQLVLHIFKLVNTTYIPTIMKNIDVLPAPKSLSAIISTMMAICDLVPSLMENYCIELTNAGFLQWLWNTRINYTTTDDIGKRMIHSSSMLLNKILTWLTGDEQCSSFYHCESHLLEGTLEEGLFLFIEQMDCFQTQQENEMKCAQITVLAMFYFCYTNKWVPTSMEKIYFHLSVYADQNELDILPAFSVKHFLLLYAASSTEHQEFRISSSFEDSGHCSEMTIQQQNLNGLLEQLTNLPYPLDKLYTHHPKFFIWSFSNAFVAKLFGSITMNNWCSCILSKSIKPEELEVFKTVIATNELCMFYIQDYLSKDIQCTEELYDLLCEISRSLPSSNCQTFYWLFKEKIINLIREFKNGNCSQLSQEQCSVSLELISSLSSSTTPEVPYIVNDYVELLQQVCSLIPKKMKTELSFTCFTFLNLLLNVTANNGDTTVLGILLSTKEVLDELQTSLITHNNKIQQVCLDLLTSLMKHQVQFKTEISHQVTLHLSVIEGMLLSKSKENNLSGMDFLIVLLQTSVQSELVNVQWPNDGSIIQTLKILNPIILNLILMGDRIHDKAIQLFYIVDVYLKQQDEHSGYFCQPWTNIFIDKHINKLLLAPLSSPILKIFLQFWELSICTQTFHRFLQKLIDHIMNSSNETSYFTESTLLILKKVLSSSYANSVSDSTKQQIEKIIQQIEIKLQQT